MARGKTEDAHEPTEREIRACLADHCLDHNLTAIDFRLIHTLSSCMIRAIGNSYLEGFQGFVVHDESKWLETGHAYHGQEEVTCTAKPTLERAGGIVSAMSGLRPIDAALAK